MQQHFFPVSKMIAEMCCAFGCRAEKGEMVSLHVSPKD